ncbi:MAG: hypothetical protein GWM98_27320 [Nitrospinaceae bacterium]|nr:hypothetical protein [Nitrospinaceae bacterium]NIR57487.1 hypothetical protein [Nitrospinaceae bacterium]NIS87957.1 hypothetical protein [Nitrospinaceae bacterium]NIT84822.1 hypothetical protein [Nitrospinaceae bacterium]NIU47002.1 hypothetical protein [Nitrospinaceae bacterium]
MNKKPEKRTVRTQLNVKTDEKLSPGGDAKPPKYEARVCVSREEREACRELMYGLLLKPPYNARSLGVIQKWLGGDDRLVYIGVFNGVTGELAGSARLMLDYDATRHDNLSPELLEYCRSGQRLVDVGHYIDPRRKDKAVVFEMLFARTIQYLLDSSCNGVYIQVPEWQVATYTRLGFSPASEPFEPPGWAHRWRGMFLRVDRTTASYTCPDYRRDWQEKTSTELRDSFWHRIMEKIKNRGGLNLSLA